MIRRVNNSNNHDLDLSQDAKISFNRGLANATNIYSGKHSNNKHNRLNDSLVTKAFSPNNDNLDSILAQSNDKKQ